MESDLFGPFASFVPNPARAASPNGELGDTGTLTLSPEEIVGRRFQQARPEAAADVQELQAMKDAGLSKLENRDIGWAQARAAELLRDVPPAWFVAREIRGRKLDRTT